MSSPMRPLPRHTAQELAAVAYRAHRPLLLSALAALARSGYEAPPIEGLALVHDFFVEAWPGLERRYDATRGAFSTYIYGAFLRFARPRIVRERRWREGLLPTSSEAIEDAHADPGERLDEARLARALTRLSPIEKRMLRARLGTSGERAAAGRVGVTRHALRERSVEALAHLAAIFGEPGVIVDGGGDWTLMRALWADGLTVAEAALSLRRTEHQVRAGRQRILKILSATMTVVSGTSVGDGRQRAQRARAGEGSEMDDRLCQTWQELVAARGKVPALSAARREALLDHVEDCDRCAAVEAKDSEALYATLGAGDEELDAADRAALAKLLAADARDEADVTRAVEDALLPSLSPRALKLVRALAEEVKPRAIFLATEAVAMLIARATRVAKMSDKIVTLDGAGAISIGARQLVPGSTTVREIARMAHVSVPAAQKLAAWLPLGALSQPRLLRGLTVEDAGASRVDLRVDTGEAHADLFARWKPSRRSSSTLPEAIVATIPEGALAAARTRKLRSPRSRIKKEP